MTPRLGLVLCLGVALGACQTPPVSMPSDAGGMGGGGGDAGAQSADSGTAVVDAGGAKDAGTIAAFTVGGSVSGLAGTLILKNNGTDPLTVSTNGAFTFAVSLPVSAAYSVTVATQPAGQTCSVANGSGTIGGSAVVNVTVVCSSSAFTIGGTVSGLNGTLVLQNNGANDLSLSSNAGFTFTMPVADGAGYAVSIKTQPAGQLCTVTNGSGTVSGFNVTNILVVCASTYTIAGSISGLSGTVVLRNNGTDPLTRSTNGAFTFATRLANGSPYAVTIETQPSGQTCTVASGSGTIVGANITTVSIACSSSTYTVSGSISGLSGSVVLQNNAGDSLTRSANGAFTFPTRLADTSGYAVTVLTHPPGQLCTVTNATGTISGADVSNVSVTCAGAYTIGGTITGLSAGTVLLQNNSGAEYLSRSTNGAFTFSTPLSTSATYNVEVFLQPGTQVCTVINGSGTVANANVTNIAINCVAPGNTVGGTITGLTGTVVLENNLGDDLPRSADGAFTFATRLTTGATYSVTVVTQPAGQYCTVSNATGTMAGADVSNVTVSCVGAYSVGGTITGLTGTVVLQNNAGDDLSRATNNAFTFATRLLTAAPYSVTVLTQPAGQVCTVTNGSGTIAGANVSSVAVSCVSTYSVGGSITNLVGTVVLQNSLGDTLSRSSNGVFTFATRVADGGGYSVTVSTQPAGQVCTVTNGSGTLAGANITNVGVNCVSLYTVGGTITGLTGTLVLQNNLGDTLTRSTDGSFTFATAVANGAPYSVTILTPPAGQTCTVSSGSGTVSGANVSTVSVTCTTPAPPYCMKSGGAVIPCTGNVGGFTSGVQELITVTNTQNGDMLVTKGNGPFKFGSTVSTASAVTIKTTVATSGLDGGQTCVVIGEDTDSSNNGFDQVTVSAGAAGFTKFGVTCGPVKLPVADTGQTLCYQRSNTNVWAANPTSCTVASSMNTLPPRQDGFVNVARAFTGPTSHATYTSDYTTADNTTGLVWKSCAEGLSGATCSTGTASALAWTDAASACRALNDANSGNGYAGRTDWRLPSLEELHGLVKASASSPSTDGNFPATPLQSFWAAHPQLKSLSYAWYVNFTQGQVYLTPRTSGLYVRCVSGTLPIRSPYQIHGDGTVSDLNTGLLWQRCSYGQTIDTACTNSSPAVGTWETGHTFCTLVTTGGRVWRLPSVNELMSITDYHRIDVVPIDPTAFPNPAGAAFLTSTTNTVTPSSYYGVNFAPNAGNVDPAQTKAANSGYSRCVTDDN